MSVDKKEKEFFLVRDDDTGATKLFHQWRNVVNFLTDEVMQYGYHIVYDSEGNNFTWVSEWRPPENREECFNLLFNVKDIGELNELLEDLYYTELIEFSD